MAREREMSEAFLADAGENSWSDACPSKASRARAGPGSCLELVEPIPSEAGLHAGARPRVWLGRKGKNGARERTRVRSVTYWVTR